MHYVEFMITVNLLTANACNLYVAAMASPSSDRVSEIRIGFWNLELLSGLVLLMATNKLLGKFIMSDNTVKGILSADLQSQSLHNVMYQL